MSNAFNSFDMAEGFPCNARVGIVMSSSLNRIVLLFLTRFSAVGLAGGRILNGVKLRFLLNNLSLHWPIDTKLTVWVAYIKRQLGIATQVSVIKVKVTVTKNRNSVSAQ